jgi:phage host-nuclease inhibitor protein Gam
MSVLQDLESKIANAHNNIITVTRKLDEISDIEISLGRASTGLTATAESAAQLTAAHRDLIGELRQATKAVEDAANSVRKADPERLIENLANLQREVEVVKSTLAGEVASREQFSTRIANSLAESSKALSEAVSQGTAKNAETLEQLQQKIQAALASSFAGLFESNKEDLKKMREAQSEALSSQLMATAGLERRTKMLTVLVLGAMVVTLAAQAYHVFLPR